MKPLRSALPVLIAVVLSAAGSTVAFADCHAKESAFDNAARSKAPPEIEHAYQDVAADVDCDFDIDHYRSRAIDAMIDALSDPAQASQRKVAEQFATEHLQVLGDWRLAEHLGDYYAASGKRRESKIWYEAALRFLPAHPAQKITVAEHKQLEKKAQSAGKALRSGHAAKDRSAEGTLDLIELARRAKLRKEGVAP